MMTPIYSEGTPRETTPSATSSRPIPAAIYTFSCHIPKYQAVLSRDYLRSLANTLDRLYLSLEQMDNMNTCMRGVRCYRLVL